MERITRLQIDIHKIGNIFAKILYAPYFHFYKGRQNLSQIINCVQKGNNKLNDSFFMKIISVILVGISILLIITPTSAATYPPALTVAAAGDLSYEIGETIRFSGTNTVTGYTYLFIIGPNLPENGAKMSNLLTTSQSGVINSFDRVAVEMDRTWTYTWNTSQNLGNSLKPGYYRIFAVSEPYNKGDLTQATLYSDLDIRLTQLGIFNCCEITEPGYYEIKTDLYGNSTGSDLPFGSPCLLITADDVSIEGGDHTITGCENCLNDRGVLVQGENVTIRNLEITNYHQGIFLEGVQDCSIYGNTVQDSNHAGILLFESNNNEIEFNILRNGLMGVHLWNSTNNKINHNSFEANDYGINTYLSDESLIKDNSFSDNWKGIFLKETRNNIVSENIIERSSRAGIYLMGSNSNTIFNNFLNNMINADFENSGENIWNATKASGQNIISGQYLAGNYWGKPDGKGYSQTCNDSNSDGICDTQYILSAGNIDYLPLTNNTSTNVTCDDQCRLLWHLNHDMLDSSHHIYHFYDEFYDYDNNAAPPDSIKENVTELDDQDIWMCYLFPFELNFMSGDDLSCGIDGDSWYSGENPSGESKPEFSVDLAEYLPDETPGEFIGLLHFVEVGVHGNGMPIYASTLHYDDFDQRAEIILKPEIRAYQSGLADMYASGNVDIYYIPATDEIQISRDLSQVDAGVDVDFFDFATSLNSSFLFFEFLYEPEFNSDLNLRGAFKMAAADASIPVDAVVPAARVETSVSGSVNLVVNDTTIFDSPPKVEGEITTLETPYIILEGALASHDFGPGESVKSPFELDVTYRYLKANSPVLRIKSDEVILHAEGNVTYDPKDFLITFPEIVQAFSFDMPFIPAYHEVLGNTEITVHSPVNLHVYDAQGRHIGKSGLDIVTEIPNSTYFEENGAKTILLPSLVKDYVILVEGTGTGVYNLTFEQPILIETDSGIIVAFLDFDLQNVTTSPGDKDYFVICTSDLIGQLQSRMAAGQDFDTALQGVVGTLDFDMDGHPDITDTNLVFAKAQPMMVVGRYQGQPLEQIPMTARILYLDQPVAGKTINYVLGGAAIGSAVTDANGFASLDYTLPGSLLGDIPLRITFEGDGTYLPSYRNTTLSIINEPPRVKLISPANYGEVNEWVEIDGSIEEAGITDVTIRIDDQIVSSMIPFHWNTSLYSNGFHVVELTAEDTFGASGSDYIAVMVNNTQDNSIPVNSSEFIVTLSEGWNLFSTPVRLDSSHAQISSLFDPGSLQNMSVVLGWDGTQWYIPEQGTAIQPLTAYYIKVKSGTSASAVIVPSDGISTPPSRVLTEGINLIGPAPAFVSENCVGDACSGGSGFSTMPIDQALVSIDQTTDGIGYTIVISPSLNQPGWAYARGGQSRDLLPFKGYWVIMENGPDTLYGFSSTPIQ